MKKAKVYGMGVCIQCKAVYQKRKGFKKACSRPCRSAYASIRGRQVMDEIMATRRVAKKISNLLDSNPAKRKKEFFASREWLELRYKVLLKYGRKCMLCNATDVIIQVDHIKPRSKYPHLALDINNLQVLCKECNHGKSNLDETDFRPKEDPVLSDSLCRFYDLF